MQTVLVRAFEITDPDPDPDPRESLCLLDPAHSGGIPEQTLRDRKMIAGYKR